MKLGLSHSLAVSAIAALVVFSPLAIFEARAAVIFQTATTTTYETRPAEDNFTTVLSVSEAVTITNIGQETDLAENGSLKFYIFDASDGTPLYVSAPKAFVDDGLSYKISDAFSFTFLPGVRYSVGSVADVSGEYGDVFGPVTSSNGITSGLRNQNVSGFATLTLDTIGNCCDSRIQLLSDASDVTVPEPISLSLLGASLAGLVVARRRQA
jgi:PEP-CTERM motif